MDTHETPWFDSLVPRPESRGCVCKISCPLHKAAGELLEALQNLTGCFSTNMLDQNNSREIWMAGLAIIRKTTEGG